MIQNEFDNGESSEPIGFSHCQLRLVVQALDDAAGELLRKIIKTRGSFPNDDAALKLLYLAIRNAGMRWRRATAWTAAMGQFAIQFGPRFPGSAR